MFGFGNDEMGLGKYCDFSQSKETSSARVWIHGQKRDLSNRNSGFD
jgi:hypothetical protein